MSDVRVSMVAGDFTGTIPINEREVIDVRCFRFVFTARHWLRRVSKYPAPWPAVTVNGDGPAEPMWFYVVTVDGVTLEIWRASKNGDTDVIVPHDPERWKVGGLR